jgi:hypothetical protein
LKAGDTIIIVQPCTEEWLKAVDYGGTATAPRWKVGSYPLFFNRRVVSIQGNRVTVNCPLFYPLNRKLSQSFIYKLDTSGILGLAGVEDLRIDIQYKKGRPTDEVHARSALVFARVENAWARRCTFLHFSLAGVDMVGASQITVRGCKALDPASPIKPANRYNFCVSYYCSNILFDDCVSSGGRHSFVSNGVSRVSGIVFHDCRMDQCHDLSEGHRAWSMGLLYDNVSVTDGSAYGLGLHNRGRFGDSHGWSSVNSVAWNCRMNQAKVFVQKPPTAQNYAVGCFASEVTGKHPPAPFSQPDGWIEGTNQAGLNPPSLYEAQLKARGCKEKVLK